MNTATTYDDAARIAAIAATAVTDAVAAYDAAAASLASAYAAHKSTATALRCRAVIRGDGEGDGRHLAIGGFDFCGRPAEAGAELECAASGTALVMLLRRNVRGANYCADHGGHARSEFEARLDWAYIAPDSVGGDDAVRAAGCLALGTPNSYIVVRQCQQGPRPWLAQLGLGGYVAEVGSFASRDEALAAARAAWRTRLSADIAGIAHVRGGSLEWGTPVEPRYEPILLEPASGESSWDCAKRQSRTI